eukprot:CAMPEP_0203892026 /NCGR_PEP_ID=MMETSP0359-20131031/35238_1 /ASSEMBLY_ACC=CAM_ASM_000338 /TAXON_ID=268821 /ORGANISM="Scrippsiella Hangoei, Strain SHTV-5" /LENGTH=568 /DNA_ID=CAMNT_0050813905 /DNA_START=60 /DNA_END=1766 /DNA_ORIENTATION=-
MSHFSATSRVAYVGWPLALRQLLLLQTLLFTLAPCVVIARSVVAQGSYAEMEGVRDEACVAADPSSGGDESDLAALLQGSRPKTAGVALDALTSQTATKQQETPDVQRHGSSLGGNRLPAHTAATAGAIAPHPASMWPVEGSGSPVAAGEGPGTFVERLHSFGHWQSWRWQPHAVALMSNSSVSLLSDEASVSASTSAVPFLVVAVALVVCLFATYHACSAEIFSREDNRSSLQSFAPQCGGSTQRPPGSIIAAPDPRFSTHSLPARSPLVSRLSLASAPSRLPITPLWSGGSGGRPRSSLNVPPTNGHHTNDQLVQTLGGLASVQTLASGAAVPSAAGADVGGEVVACVGGSKCSSAPDRVYARAAIAARAEWSDEADLGGGAVPGLGAAVEEAHMEIPVAALQAAVPGSEVTILGPLGKAWGKAVLREDQGFRSISIVMTNHQGDTPVASVAVVSLGGSDGPTVEIRTPDGFPFGMVSRRPGSAFAFEARPACGAGGEDAAPLVVLNGDPTNLRLTAVAGADGSPQASAARGRARAGGEERLELRMMKGVDTALLLTCMLAVMVLF